jgi:hypothetical protein
MICHCDRVQAVDPTDMLQEDHTHGHYFSRTTGLLLVGVRSRAIREEQRGMVVPRIHYFQGILPFWSMVVVEA